MNKSTLIILLIELGILLSGCATKRLNHHINAEKSTKNLKEKANQWKTHHGQGFSMVIPTGTGWREIPPAPPVLRLYLRREGINVLALDGTRTPLKIRFMVESSSKVNDSLEKVSKDIAKYKKKSDIRLIRPTIQA
ncbi:MAG: hypothetical protein MJH11_14010, partial [Lentisphaeria bacterium]|nr:hypothetical protein [Lentisphaeria bacterium]